MNKIKLFLEKYKTSSIVFKASIWFILVTIIDNCISLLTQPFVNRIMSVEEVGVYNVYNTWATIFRIIATFNLFCGVFEVLIVDNKEDQEQVRGSLCFLSTMLTIIFFAIIFIVVNPLAQLLKLKPIYFLVMLSFVLSEEIVQFYLVPLRFNYKYVRYSIIVISLFLIKSVLTILLAYTFVDDRVLGRIIGIAAPAFLAGCVLFVIIMSKTSLKSLTKYWKQGIKFNIPLIPHYLSSLLLASSDKIMLNYLSTEYNVGLYSVVYSFSSLSLIVFTAINNSYTPWAYNAIRNENYIELKKKTNIIVLLSILFCFGLMLFAPEGIYILGGKAYLEALNIVPILVVGTFFSSFYFIFSNVEFINKKTKVAFPITLLGTLINIGLNWLLIPTIGYEVAAYTTLLGYIIIAFCHYLYSYYIVKKNIYDIKTILLMILFLILGMIGCIGIYQLHFIFRYILIVIFAALFIIFGLRFYKKKRENQTQIEE